MGGGGILGKMKEQESVGEMEAGLGLSETPQGEGETTARHSRH